MSQPATTQNDLLILGLLLDRPMHGYELHQQIQTEGISSWFSISMAGIYYSLGKLRDQGWVAESGQPGGRTTRKAIYHLTEEGRKAFFAAMEAQPTPETRACLEYDLIIYLLNRLPLKRATLLLEKRQQALAEQAEQVKQAVASTRNGGCSPLTLAILDHNLRFLEMEQGWLADVLQEIRAGGQPHSAHPEERQGLMILSGDLSHYHLPDLIRLIAAGRHSGTLSVTDGAVARALSFEAGQPMCASLLSRHASSQALPPAQQALEAVYDLFRWQEGRFTFDQQICSREQCVLLHIGVGDLILGGCRWVDNWATIQRVVPSAETIFERVDTPQHLDGLRLTQTEEQIWAAVDGQKDVATLARELGLTLFEISRSLYCLAMVEMVRTADADKIRLRRVFREIAELMCRSTVAWRTSPDDQSCEKEVNEKCAGLPVRLNSGRIEDQTEPQVQTEALVGVYRQFLLAQIEVVSARFGRDNAHQSFQRTLNQLAPELQAIARRYGFDRLLTS